MKQKSLFLFVVVGFLSFEIYAQDIGRVISTPEFNWYGLDFTEAKMIGSAGFTDPNAIVNKYIHGGWNALIKTEFKKKFDTGKPMGKKANIYFDVCDERNQNVTEEGLIIDEEYNLLPKDVQAIVNEYPKISDGGMGLVYIVESFNKNDVKGYIWMTFFDEKTGEILLTERVAGAPKGLGFRNYWSGAVYEVIKLNKKQYKDWVKKFG